MRSTRAAAFLVFALAACVHGNAAFSGFAFDDGARFPRDASLLDFRRVAEARAGAQQRNAAAASLRAD